MRTGLLIRVATAFRGMSADRLPARRCRVALADVPHGQRRDGFPQPVIRGKDAVIAVPVLPRRRHEVREEQLMKQVALGRKNWMFIGSVAAGYRAADHMSLVSRAHRNDPPR